MPLFTRLTFFVYILASYNVVFTDLNMVFSYMKMGSTIPEQKKSGTLKLFKIDMSR